LLEEYAYIGLLLAVAVLFAITTLLIPFFLSLPARVEHCLQQFRKDHPGLSRLVPNIRPPKVMQIVPYKPDPVKTSTYECGMEPVGKAWVQFNFRYYFYALVFVALDVLVIFLYAWAVGLKGLGLFGLIAAGFFVFIVLIGYVYAWRKKVLEWK
jgi:NADH-quinone oxidoreductase subunit A